MNIDIAPTADGYVVVAHLESGDAHDFFSTQAEAVAFAQAFYGGKVVAIKPTPKTTAEAIAQYGTTANRCGCPDHQLRQGGSHFDERTRERVCKHQLAVRNAQAPAQPQYRTSTQDCTCADRSFALLADENTPCKHMLAVRAAMKASA